MGSTAVIIIIVLAVLAIVGFNLIMFAFLEIPLLGFLLAPERTRALTERLDFCQHATTLPQQVFTLGCQFYAAPDAVSSLTSPYCLASAAEIGSPVSNTLRATW